MSVDARLGPVVYQAVALSSWYVTPSMVRVRLGGAGLSGFTSTDVPDERLRLVFDQPNGQDPVVRSYTVREFDPAGPFLDIDFVVHDGGVAARWAVDVQPGDRIQVSDARGWYRPPADTEWQLLIADMTGLPALTRAVEQLPSGMRAHVIAWASSEQDRQIVPTDAAVTYQWIHPSRSESVETTLLDAVDQFTLPTGIGYLWAATEAGEARAIRHLFHRQRGWTPDRFEIKGYWRRDKEDWQRRYSLVQERIDTVRNHAVAAGLTGHELIEAVDAALEDAGL
jgi:NADPH-dependent ferric siderophore reductase